MSKEEEIRNRFRNIYGMAVEKFFNELKMKKISNDELEPYSSLFLPSYGTEYAGQKTKIAVVGRSTNWWHDSLKEDVVRYFGGGYEMEFGFKEFQKNGPPKWKNQFWRYVEQFLVKVYGEWNVPIQGGDVFPTIAWGNRFAIEPVSGGTIWKRLSELADECGLTCLDNFIEVFQPDVILHLCENQEDSNAIFPMDTVCEAEVPPPIGGDQWVLRLWRRTKDVYILQSQHPSWLRRQKVSEADFGKIAGDELVKHCDFRKRRLMSSGVEKRC